MKKAEHLKLKKYLIHLISILLSLAVIGFIT